MKSKKQSLIKHSLSMLARNRKSYAMLSVTIVLSFSILLGYLIYSDSVAYNRYKHAFSSPSNVVFATRSADISKLGMFIAMVELAEPNAQYYSYISVNTKLSQYSNIVNAEVAFLPEGNRPIIQQQFLSDGTIESIVDTVRELELIEGRRDMVGNEAVISEALYRCVFGDKPLPELLNVPIELENGELLVLKLEVVGICRDEFGIVPRYYETSDMYVINSWIYCRQGLIDDISFNRFLSGVSNVVFCSDEPWAIIKTAERLGYTSHSSYRARLEAIEMMKSNSTTKMYISIALFMILGINLYGCFENALKERRFEVGVKRALGASGVDIICQFMTEGIVVTLANVLLSVSLVSCIAAAYKLIRTIKYARTWIIHVTPYSILMFAVCSISIIIIYSALFAFRATRVEIVKYLKAE